MKLARWAWIVALPCLAQLPPDLAAELERLKGQAAEMTRPGVSLDARKQYVDRVLKLREAIERAAAKPVLTLASLTVDGSGLNGARPTSTFEEKIQGEWRLQPFQPSASASGKSTQAAYLLNARLILPGSITLGEDFTIGLCGGVTLLNRGGDPPRAADRLQHETFVSVSPRANYARSFQQFSQPPAPGAEVRSSQTPLLRYRFDAASSNPPQSYSYRAEAVQTGSDENRSRFSRGSQNSTRPPEGITFLFGSRTSAGPLGTETTSDAPPAFLSVKLEQALLYGLVTPDSAMLTFHQTAFREWNALYRVARPGESASLRPPPFTGTCEAGSLGGMSSAPPPVTVTRVNVPELRGRTAAEAAAALRAAGLVARPRVGPAASGGATENTVALQSPAPGNAVDPGSAVELVLHGPPAPAVSVPAPDVAGLTAAEARAALDRAGLRIRPSIGSAAPNAANAHRVQSQTPAAGSPVAAGSEVKVVLFAAAAEVETARTPFRIPPPPPSRTFQCPPAAGGWRNINSQAVSQLGPGRMEAICYYSLPPNPNATVVLQYRERGYHDYDDACPSNAAEGRYIFLYRGEDTRGLSGEEARRVYGWGLSNQDRLTNEISRPTFSSLAAQAVPFAESCSAPPPPITNCDDNPLCAIPCPVVPGFDIAEPTVAPRVIWRANGSVAYARCTYRSPRKSFSLYIEVDADPSRGRIPAPGLGHCGKSEVVAQGSAFNVGIATLFSTSKRVHLRTSSIPQGVPEPLGPLMLDLMRKLEPRSSMPCVP